MCLIISSHPGIITEDVNKPLPDSCFCVFCRRDVFACIGLPEGDPSWERSFSRWPLGVCDYLVPIQRQFHPEEWAHHTRNIYNWSEPHNRCKHRQKQLMLLNRYIVNPANCFPLLFSSSLKVKKKMQSYSIVYGSILYILSQLVAASH